MFIKKDYSEFISYTNVKKEQLDFLHSIMFAGKDDSEYEKSDNVIIKPDNPQQKTYLYMNPVLVELFFNIREYSQYNISAFSNCLIHCNNVLAIDYQSKIGLNDAFYNYDTAVLEVKKALNELNSVIYNLPSTKVSYNKFSNVINMLHGILNKHIKDIGILYINLNKTKDIDLFSYPDNFYDEYFKISFDDTKTRDYISTYDMY